MLGAEQNYCLFIIIIIIFFSFFKARDKTFSANSAMTRISVFIKSKMGELDEGVEGISEVWFSGSDLPEEPLRPSVFLFKERFEFCGESTSVVCESQRINHCVEQLIKVNNLKSQDRR